jgi:import receptor subunit TOM20
VAASLGLSYALYFDYKRRADPKFRNRLKKQRKKVEETSRLEATTSTENDVIIPGGINIEAILNQPLPTSPQDREKFFLEQLSKGETLSKNGPEFFEAAAATFYLALKVYPSPAELVVLYQKTLSDEIFNLIMGFISSEVKRRQEQYFVLFPPSEMNVRIVDDLEANKGNGGSEREESATALRRRNLVAGKTFAAGEVIYVEDPIVATLEPNLLLSGEYCSYCMKCLDGTASIFSKKTSNGYCSSSCEAEAWETFESLLYSDYASSGGSSTQKLMKEASAAMSISFVQIAQFLAFMVYEDMKKSTMPNPEGFGVWDHLERLRYLEIQPTEDDKAHMAMLRDLLSSKVPGLEEFLNEERYLLLKGKFLYNQFAITGNPGANNRDEGELQANPQCTDPKRSASAPTTFVGTGLYPVSSYLGHSCSPNVVVTYPENNRRLALVASQPIKKGEVLNVSFVEHAEDKEIRHERLSKWRCKCICELCVGGDSQISQAAEE